MPTPLLALLALMLTTTPLACASTPRTQPTTQDMRNQYTVSLPQPQTQMADISLTLREVTTPTIDLTLPVWRPGRYHVLDLAGAIQDERATDLSGNPLRFEKIDKTTWRIHNGNAASVRFSYRLYANEIKTRLRHVDDTHAFLSPSAVFVYNPDRRDEPLRIDIEAPDHWKIATGLDIDPSRPRSVTAPNYDVLVDSPLEIGEHETIRFDVENIPHDIVIWGRAEPDARKLADDFKAIVRAEADIFDDFPYNRYVFIIHSNPGMGGGTEHLNSTVMGCEPAAFTDEDAYKKFLGLVSHEMFHTWNVKQLRPRGIQPYDYQRENYTDLLWVAEGTTSYYDDIVLARTGLITAKDYFGRLAGSIDAYMRLPGRNVQSLSASSFDAWIKFNKSTPNSHNSTVDFYREGSLASLLLDMEIRRLTDNQSSLDDLMRNLYEAFPLAVGYTKADVIEGARALTGHEFDDFFARYIDGTEPFPLADAVALAGLELALDDDEPRADIGFDVTDRNGLAAVTKIRADGPALDCGLIVDDLIVAIDGERLTASNFNARLKRLEPGERILITYFRYDILRETEVTLASRPAGSWKLKKTDNPTEAQKAVYESWLGIPWDKSPTPAPDETAAAAP